MLESAKIFMKKEGIAPHDVIYIVREGRQTALHLTDGRVVGTYLPLKYFRQDLSPNEFFNITKGVLVSAAQISNIENGVYTMNNGKVFNGRLRGVGEHNRNRLRLESALYPVSESILSTLNTSFSALDKMPLPFFVIEVVFDSKGHGVDFIFRYCNEYMCKFEHLNKEKVINHSFGEVFNGVDKKWLITCADVAYNGTVSMVRTFSSEINREVSVCCFQPAVGFCACLLFDDSLIDKNIPRNE